jgi:hypothetical protein
VKTLQDILSGALKVEDLVKTGTTKENKMPQVIGLF